jgi:hypothetical protein
MGNRRKAETDSYEVGILKISWDDIQSGVKSTDFPGRSILSRTEFQQPVNFKKS